MVKSGNRTGALLLVFVVITLMLSSCNNKSNSGNRSNDNYDAKNIENPISFLGVANEFNIVAQNDDLALLINKEYGLISLKNRKSGAVFSTTGYGNELSGVTLENTKNLVYSHIVLEFYNNRDKETIYNSYEHCLKDNQIKYSGIKNGLRLYYTIGKPDTRTVLPDVITAKTMENVVFPKIDEEQKEMIDIYFTLFDPNKLDEASINEIAKNYPLVKKEPIYVAKNIGFRFKIKLTEIFKSAGLTIDSIQEEYEEIGYAAKYEEQPCFTIPVDYTINNGAFCVSVDCSQIKYNSTLFKLTKLELLPYFGSMNYTENGYMFLPDGSGILINGNSTDIEGVNLTLFGEDKNDNSMKADEEIVTRNAIMPVFGIKNGSEALFAIVEEGAGIAKLYAGTSAGPSTLNHIAPTFELLHRESSESKGLIIGSNIVRYAKKSYQGKISIRYYLLSGDKANYAGMAEIYRDYLFAERNPLKKETPFYISSIGTVNRNERFLGLPVVRQRALTNTEQAKQIMQTLISEGVNNIAFIYHNWICDENDSKIPLRAKPSKAIGGKNGLNKLSEFTKQNGIDFFLNLQLTLAKKSSFLGGFNSWTHSAKALDGTYAFEEGFCLSPENILKAAGKLKKGLGKFKSCKISVDTLGSDLYSDYTEKNGKLREEAISYYIQTAQLLTEDSLLLTDVGNSYMLPYVSDITNLPLSGSRYSAESKSVPFAPMVLHGYVNYCGEPLNLQTDKRKEFLRSIEYGAGLYFILNNAKSEMLKQTHYTDLFSSEYSVWISAASEYYREAKKVYESTAGAKIIRNETVGDNVYKTDYDNGISVYVNYNSQDCSIDGYKVPKKSFVLAGK